MRHDCRYQEARSTRPYLISSRQARRMLRLARSLPSFRRSTDGLGMVVYDWADATGEHRIIAVPATYSDGLP